MVYITCFTRIICLEKKIGTQQIICIDIFLFETWCKLIFFLYRMYCVILYKRGMVFWAIFLRKLKSLLSWRVNSASDVHFSQMCYKHKKYFIFRLYKWKITKVNTTSCCTTTYLNKIQKLQKVWCLKVMKKQSIYFFPKVYIEWFL